MLKDKNIDDNKLQIYLSTLCEKDVKYVNRLVEHTIYSNFSNDTNGKKFSHQIQRDASKI